MARNPEVPPKLPLRPLRRYAGSIMCKGGVCKEKIGKNEQGTFGKIGEGIKKAGMVKRRPTAYALSLLKRIFAIEAPVE